MTGKSEPIGFYYLHENGDLIYKRTQPELDSPFVKRIWPVYPEDRACAWIICIEALALGASKERVNELVNKWGLTNEDAFLFAQHLKFELLQVPEGWRVRYSEDTREAVAETPLEAFAAFAKVGLTSQPLQKLAY